MIPEDQDGSLVVTFWQPPLEPLADRVPMNLKEDGELSHGVAAMDLDEAIFGQAPGHSTALTSPGLGPRG